MKAAGDDDDAHKNEAQIQIVGGRIFERKIINRVGDVAKAGADPKKHCEAAEQIFAEFDPFGRRSWRRQRVWTVAREICGRFLRCEAALEVGLVALDEIVEWNLMLILKAADDTSTTSVEARRLTQNEPFELPA